MTTEGEIVELVRDVNVLLHLDTYQGMSDAEIQSIIDFKVDEAKRDARNELELETQFQETHALVAAREAHAQAAANMLESMMGMEIPWVTVGGES